MVDYCETLRKQQSQEISRLSKKLVRQGVLDDFGLYEGTCELQPHFEGVIDIRDKVLPPLKELSTPSIAWDCDPSQCSIEADLPVPPQATEELKEYINKISECGVSAVHEYSGTNEIVPPENHVHLVCKGVHPVDLGSTVKDFVLEVLKYRGHVI